MTRQSISRLCIFAMILVMAGPSVAALERERETSEGAMTSFVSSSGYDMTAFERGSRMDVVITVGNMSMTFTVENPTTTSNSISVFVGDAVFTETFGTAGKPSTMSILSATRGEHTQIDLLSQANNQGFISYQDEDAAAAFLANADTGVPDILQAVLLDAQPDLNFWAGVEEMLSEMGADTVDPVGSGCFNPCLACLGAILLYVASLAGLGTGCGPAIMTGIGCVWAFVLHTGASMAMIAACNECAGCKMDLNDGGRKDDTDNNGTNNAHAQG